MFKAVDINRHRGSCKTQYRSERRICGIANQGSIKAFRDSVNRRKKGMNHCVKVFVSDCGENLEPHAVEFELPWRNIVCATVDGYLMSTRNKASREVFCKGLKPSVA